MKQSGLLGDAQLVVAAVTLTLFVPCVAQFLMNVKERGAPVGIRFSLFVLFFSLGTGYTLKLVLRSLGMGR